LGIDESVVAPTIRERTSMPASAPISWVVCATASMALPCFFLNGYRHAGDFRSLGGTIASMIDRF
jgi:hypothetical protein